MSTGQRNQEIQGNLQFRSQDIDAQSIKHQDPLWHSRTILNELLKNCMSVAVTPGVVTLDESSVRTKAKCRAKTYLPSKPDKYTIRFYALNCWHSLYLQNLYDNGAGNKTNLSCSERCLQTFPELRTIYNSSIEYVSMDKIIHGMEEDKQSWLWSLQMTHRCKKNNGPKKKGLVITDNFYTRHSTNASTTYKKAMNTFRTSLQKSNTAPMITLAFENIFNRVRKGYEVPLPYNKLHTKEMNDLFHKTLAHQLEIEPAFFLRGFISTNWDVVQNVYLKQKDYNNKQTDWVVSVIKAIWEFSCTMWKSRCDFIHGNLEGKTKSARRKELLDQIRKELTRTEYHADHANQQLRKNVEKSMGNAKTDTLVIWLDMLCNVKGETFFSEEN